MKSEREMIYQSLSRSERRILAIYENKHGCRLHGACIYKVIQDQKEIERERRKGRKKK